MITAIKYVRIDRAHCKGCGDKAALKVKGVEYPLPATMDAAVVERTPWRCGDCRGRIELDVEVVE